MSKQTTKTPPGFAASRRGFLLGRFGQATPVEGRNLVPEFLPNCLALQGVVCQTCSDRCDVSAIRFMPRIGTTPHPELLTDRCTGCGDCIPDCPVQAVRLVSLPPIDSCG